MTHTIQARNVSEALYLAKQGIEATGVQVQTRNGPVLEFPTPVVTTYTHSRERALFYPERDANPFFHLMEAFWMLAGRNDVKWINQFNGRINTYSDDGVSFHGAYGYRWRNWFGKDQLKLAMHRLTTYPNDRRTVVSMWDANHDLVTTNDGKDYPCNTQIFFQVRDETLNMTVVNRSNDMIWGAYGANAVHMSVLLEYMAQMLGLQVGHYVQFSNNLHAYVEVLNKLQGMQPQYSNYELVDDSTVLYQPPNLVDDPTTFDQELELFMYDGSSDHEYRNSYIAETAVPMYQAWQQWKGKDKEGAFFTAMCIQDKAWRKACTEWFERRL